MSVLINVVNNLNRLTFSNKVIVYVYLRNNLALSDTQIQLPVNASDPEFFRSLLDRKKELAIIDLYNALPFLDINNVPALNALLKVLPVLLSYSSLYEMKVNYVSQILDMVRVHPVFANRLHIFIQWFVVFEKRKLNRSREFNYKDEFYFHNLPTVENIPADSFSQKIGYCNIALLRAFHRWLRFHRLHKYLFVFANLTYEQIINMDESNIDQMVGSVGISVMTIGAKNKMLRELAELRARQFSLIGNVIWKPFQNVQDIENAIKTIKKVLRTPIKVNDDFNENIPGLLVRSFAAVCEAILFDVVSFCEGMIPLYGLLISLLKEAWGYTIFSSAEKDRFNEMRNKLSEKINNNFNLPVQLSESGKFSHSTSTLCLPDLMDNFSNFD